MSPEQENLTPSLVASITTRRAEVRARPRITHGDTPSSLPLTRFRQKIQIPANALEFHRRHLNRSSILGVRDGQVLLVNVHELDIVLAQPVGLGALKHQVHRVGRVLRLQSQDVFILGSAQDLGQRAQVDAEGDVAVTAVGGETLCTEEHGDQGNVRVVHGLEGDPGVIAVEVAVLDQVLDGLNDLVRRNQCAEMMISGSSFTYPLQKRGLFQSCFQHWVPVSIGFCAPRSEELIGAYC